MERHFKHNSRHAHEGSYVRCTIRGTTEERGSEGARTTSELTTQETDPPPFWRRVVAGEGKDWLEWTSTPRASALQHSDQRETADTCSTPKARPAQSIHYFPARRQHRRKSIDFRYGLTRRTQQPFDVAHRANIALGWVDRSLRLRDMPSEGNAENTDQQGSVSWPLFVGAICRHQRVAAISTSASQPKAPRLRFPHAALTGVGKFSGGAGNTVVIMGSYCRALRRLGQFLKTAAQLVARIICHGPAASLLGRAAYPPITSSGIDGTSRIAC